MRSAATIQSDIDKLRAARAKAAKVVQFGDRRAEYRSDAELAAALAALEAELEQAQGTVMPRTIVVRPPDYKGW